MKDRFLEGKTAIVTGSGQGIGRAAALCLAQYGAKVITNNRRPGSSINAFEGRELDFTPQEREELEKFGGDAETTAAKIRSSGGEAIAVYADVSKKEDAKRLVQTAIDAWGRIDIIINNASSNWVGNIMDMSEELWDIQITSKLSGTFYLMHAALPCMKEQGFGRILNSSSDAYQGISKHAAYGAGNAGVVTLTRSAAKDLAGTGITVNAYTPLARTRSWFNARTNYRLSGIPPQIIEDNAPAAMKRTAEGMVPFLAYLASEEAADITGKVFQLAADGQIGIWNEPQILKDVKQEDGFWTMPALQEAVPALLAGVETTQDKL